MAEYVKVRGLSRKGVRIGKVVVTSRSTVTLNLDDPKTRQELAHHTAIGQVVTVGEVAPAATAVSVVNSVDGLILRPTSGTTVRGLDLSAGQVRQANGTLTTVNAITVTYAAPDATNPRVDLVQVIETTGVVSLVGGVARATGPAAPAATTGPPAGVPLWNVVVPPVGSTQPVTLIDVRPFNP